MRPAHASEPTTAHADDRRGSVNACAVLYMGDDATLCQRGLEDVRRTEALFGGNSGSSGSSVVGPAAIHAIATGDGGICYLVICGVCYISVGPCCSSEILRAWQAHALTVGLPPPPCADAAVLTPWQCPNEEPASAPCAGSQPLAQWLDTPSEDDAKIDDIASAASSSPGCGALPRSGHVSSPFLSPYTERDPDARSVGGSSVATTSALSSCSSGVHSVGSRKSLSQRRKTQRRRRCDGAGPAEDAAGAPKFTCTFCSTTSFSTVGNWTRHEEATHLILRRWICAPSGAKTRLGSCVYCRCGPCATAKCEYSCRSRCAAKHEDERAFARKDHLKQHLRTVHRVGWSPAFNRWFVDSALPQRSRCGFCGAWFNTWAQRKKHIAGEFKDGRRMDQWRGDWGLTPDWEGRLDNAVLPETVFAASASDEELPCVGRRLPED